MAYQIVTDSCCNLPGSIIDSLELKILSYDYIDENQNAYKSYEKGIDKETDLQRFFQQMREGHVFTTSLPKLENAEKCFRNILESGKDILYLSFSSALSGGYEAVSIIAHQLEKEFPKQKIRTIDTLAASLGEGMLVYHAAQMAKEGFTFDEVTDWVLKNRQHIAHWFTVSDLVYLFRGGRVSRTSAWAANLLNIKPVCHVDEKGHLVPLEKTRGRKKSIYALVKHMEETYLGPTGRGKTFMICHGDCIEDANLLKREIVNKWPDLECITYYLDPVIGAHAGPGALGLFFLASNR